MIRTARWLTFENVVDALEHFVRPVSFGAFFADIEIAVVIRRQLLVLTKAFGYEKLSKVQWSIGHECELAVFTLGWMDVVLDEIVVQL